VKKTLTQGISYSPQEEEDFQKFYQRVAAHPENQDSDALNEWHPVQSFSDASFASTIEFKSVSGTCVFYRGCPVAWKSSVQTLSPRSTFECEWVAMSDLLLTSSETCALSRFVRGKSELEANPKSMGPLWCGNRAAVISAKKPLLSDVARKSRHMAIRLCAVRDERARICFCPTDLQRADGLTKGSLNPEAYEMLFKAPASSKSKWDEEPEPMSCLAFALDF
jgi:hypothetical protein